jgi:tetratricopeptide (TPR) repeat protein
MGPVQPQARGRLGGGPWLILGLLAAIAIVAVLALRGGKGSGGMNSTMPPSPATIAERLQSASGFFQAGEYAKAEGVLRLAAIETPNDQEVRERLAEALLAQKKSAEAYEQYTEAIRIGPRRPDLDFAAGTMASQAGKLDLSLGHYQAAQEADKTNAAYPLYAGQVQLKLGQVDAAKASLLRAATLQPESAIAWGQLAEIALNENNTRIALQHVAKARAIQPEVLAWRLVEARAHKRIGEPAAGVKVLGGVAPADRLNREVLQTLAECHGMLSQPEKAAEEYALAAKAKPEEAEFAYQAAVWYERAGNKAEAQSFAKRAVELGHQRAPGLLAKVSER